MATWDRTGQRLCIGCLTWILHWPQRWSISRHRATKSAPALYLRWCIVWEHSSGHDLPPHPHPLYSQLLLWLLLLLLLLLLSLPLTKAVERLCQSAGNWNTPIAVMMSTRFDVSILDPIQVGASTAIPLQLWLVLKPPLPSWSVWMSGTKRGDLTRRCMWKRRG